MLERGAALEEMEASWQRGTTSFRKSRKEFLLYE